MSKKDVILKPVDVKVGELELQLIYKFSSILKLEEEYGSIDEAFSALEEGGLADVLNIIYAGTVKNHKDLTKDELADEMELAKMEEYSAKMEKALTLAFPEVDEKKVEEAKKKAKKKKE